MFLNFISERYYKVLYQLFCFAPFAPPPSSYSLAMPLLRSLSFRGTLTSATMSTYKLLLFCFLSLNPLPHCLHLLLVNQLDVVSPVNLTHCCCILACVFQPQTMTRQESLMTDLQHGPRAAPGPQQCASFLPQVSLLGYEYCMYLYGVYGLCLCKHYKPTMDHFKSLNAHQFQQLYCISRQCFVMQAVLLAISIVYTVAAFVLVYLARIWFARKCPLAVAPLPSAGHSPPAESRRRSPPRAHVVHQDASAAAATAASSTLNPHDVSASASQQQPAVSFEQRGFFEVSVSHANIHTRT